MKKSVFVVAAILFALTAGSASASNWEKYDEPVPTTVTVRVMSHGAKAMNPNTGALVVIRDAATNDVLAKGDVQGSTGDMTALMNVGYPRVSGTSGVVAGAKGLLPTPDGGCTEYAAREDVASFTATLMLSRPTQVVIEAHGPMIPHQAGGSALTTTWLFPGEDVSGEGIVLELRGLIVDVLASMKESDLDLDKLGDGIPLPFYMRMMCGCPIAPKSMGFPWEAEDFKITVQAYYKGELYYEDVKTADKMFLDVSQFKTAVPVPGNVPEGEVRREEVKIRVMAAQPSQANFGMDEFKVYLNR